MSKARGAERAAYSPSDGSVAGASASLLLHPANMSREPACGHVQTPVTSMLQHSRQKDYKLQLHS